MCSLTSVQIIIILNVSRYILGSKLVALKILLLALKHALKNSKIENIPEKSENMHLTWTNYKFIGKKDAMAFYNFIKFLGSGLVEL